ncbi:MAG: branched-chain amino acid ABC transporter permease [Thermoleophilia bacterium]|nr:branched-chain amino acid ABC transporter permease [Thermoleophilia bacterium]
MIRPAAAGGDPHRSTEVVSPVSLVIQNLFTGLTYGMVLFLIAAGLSIVMGIMGITNLAHGALYMVGAYVGWTVAVKYHQNYFLGVVAGGLAAGFVGLFIQLVFLNRLYKQPNEQVLLTFGFILIITNLVIWIWGPTSGCSSPIPRCSTRSKSTGSPSPRPASPSLGPDW